MTFFTKVPHWWSWVKKILFTPSLSDSLYLCAANWASSTSFSCFLFLVLQTCPALLSSCTLNIMSALPATTEQTGEIIRRGKRSEEGPHVPFLSTFKMKIVKKSITFLSQCWWGGRGRGLAVISWCWWWCGCSSRFAHITPSLRSVLTVLTILNDRPPLSLTGGDLPGQTGDSTVSPHSHPILHSPQW